MVTHVAEQDSDDTDGQVELDGQVGQRDRLTGCPQDELLFGPEVARGITDGAHGGHEVERVS
ncbi:hypothetical protein BKM31_44175 [[Actinomadura] parvosata subsp. kistnae]|uniref:Uncharacterized protein n=1 Tax=[Actinomadura] parvosata subsp. kistnae TaxID=1909395 RepID=A0A1V0ABH6_9ACTN|nr:hypothetical protein BKM31_44175 [Nonomuraea sp. ATCC 55076]